jgi:heme-degrading monooxygenase HmoA
MPISMTQHAPRMPAEAYEQIIANVGQPLRESDGFISHAAEITPDGVTVTEVWETQEQWERWFNASVRPHLLADAPEPTSPNCTTHSVARRQRRSYSRLQGRTDDARHRRD